MDLLSLLEIDRSLISPEAHRSLLVAEMAWSAAGYPQDLAGLCAVLERTLRSCTAQAIWYAPIFLQRKKAIERGTWRPVARPGRQTQTSRSLQSSVALPTQMIDGETCSRCDGSGILTAPDSKSGTLCSCGAYLARLRKSTQANANAT